MPAEGDHAEREHRVEEAIHNGEMEGLYVTSETRADADDTWPAASTPMN
jgi:Antitoxin VbhA